MYPLQEWANHGYPVLKQSLSKHTTPFTKVSCVHSAGCGVCFIPQLAAHYASHQSPVRGVSLNCHLKVLWKWHMYYCSLFSTGESLFSADYGLLHSFSSCLLIQESRIVGVAQDNAFICKTCNILPQNRRISAFLMAGIRWFHYLMSDFSKTRRLILNVIICWLWGYF